MSMRNFSSFTLPYLLKRISVSSSSFISFPSANAALADMMASRWSWNFTSSLSGNVIIHVLSVRTRTVFPSAPMALYLFDITGSTNFKLWFANHVHQQISAIHYCIWAVIQSVMMRPSQYIIVISNYSIESLISDCP